MKRTKSILLIIIALGLGFFIRGLISPSSPHPHSPSEETAEPEVWTCSMHPQIQLPKFGKCPICFMDLIPLEAGTSQGGEREISISKYAAKLMDIETAPVERKFAEAEIRMVGKVDYDETKQSFISAWVPGRIDRLFVDYTGIAVQQGDPLVELYSPELLTAQEELLQSIKQNPSLVESAREKLRLWGLTGDQIAKIEERNTAKDRLTIHAPASGIVIHKNATEGMYVKTGSKIYTIVDLSRVWIQLDAYESDLQWLRENDTASFTSEAYPGDSFEGIIEFISPTLNPVTRTVRVRIVADNTEGRLKPGMFVRATVLAKPRVEEAPILIPVTAPMKTGKRAVVYVEVPNKEKPTYEGREITLGARLGDYYIVKHGLKEGEQVVTRGAFKLDAELQLQAKPSMMSIPSEQHSDHPMEMKPQTHCPVMGGGINKDVFVDYKGQRIYFCCAGCEGTFLKDAETYLKEMRANGIEPEKLRQPQTICPVMGNPINKDVYVDHNGLRVYFCCPGCDGTFLEEPDKYIEQMRAEGIEPEKVEQNHVH